VQSAVPPAPVDVRRPERGGERALPAPATGSADRQPITAREVIVACVGACLLSIGMNWPIAAHLGSHIGEDLGDPVRTAWQLAWQGHAVLHHPLHLWNANAFWPHRETFAFSDSLLGYLPASLIGHGPVAALVRYNLLFLFAYALCFVGAYLLARELGVRRWAAVVAGAAFAYAPFRLSMNGHLHVISSGGIPLVLFLLLRGYRRGSARTVLAGWLVAAWQLTLGFTLGLQLGYLLLVLVAIAAVVWLRRGRPRLPRPAVVATGVGVIVVAAVVAFQARPLLQVARDYPNAHRAGGEIAHYSAPPKAFLSAPPEDRLWGSATASVRHTLNTPNEQNQFPGIAVVMLAIVGVGAGTVYSRRLRAGIAIAVFVLAVTALGYGVLNGDLTYRLLHHAPGWAGVRTPGRLATLSSLGLALLAAAGVHRIAAAASGTLRRRRARVASAAPAVIACVAAAAVLAEGLGTVPNPAVPPVPAGLAAVPAPQLPLPTNPAFDRGYQYWSTGRFQPIVNGVATFSFTSQNKLRQAMNAFPNVRSVELLRRMGVRTVILHLDIHRLPIPLKWLAPHPRYARLAAAKSVASLPLTMTRHGSYIVYALEPLPGAGS